MRIGAGKREPTKEEEDYIDHYIESREKEYTDDANAIRGIRFAIARHMKKMQQKPTIVYSNKKWDTTDKLFDMKKMGGK